MKTPITPQSVQRALRFDFEREREMAEDALRRVIRAAEVELERMAESPNYLPGTDFVSPYATRYAEQVAAMHATSSAMAYTNKLAEQTENPTAS